MDAHFFAGITKIKLNARKFQKDDDFSDRVNHALTSVILVFFSLVVSARQYIGKPISCWVPSEFTKSQEDYAESVCWVSNTYFISASTKTIPETILKRNESKIMYYQWVPFVLMLQAIMFNVPCLIWRLFNWQTGIHLSSIIEITAETETIKDSEGRKASIIYVTRYIEQSLRHQKSTGKGLITKCKNCFAKLLCLWFGKGYGNYLTSLYFSIKFLYIINVIGQFFLMNEFIGSNYTFYGLDLIRHLSSGYSWEESGNFPRVTFCDFEVRKLANSHRYTVQCVLPINMFNEKIFIFLWFWLVFLASISVGSLLQWMTRIGLESSRLHFIRKFLKLRNILHSSDMKASCDFTNNYLRQDGIFILRLMSQNVGELITSEVVDRLWKNYKTHLTIDGIDKRKQSTLGHITTLPDDISQALYASKSGTACNQRLSIQPIHTSSSSSQSTIKSHPGRKTNKRIKHKKDRNNISLDHLEEDPGEFV